MYKKSTLLPLLLGGLGLIATNTAVLAKTSPPNYSAFAQQAKQLRPVSAILAAQKSALVDNKHTLHTETALGVPTFLWAQGSRARASKAAAVATDSAEVETTARNHLSRHAGLYRLDKTALQSAKLQHVHNTGRGVVIAQFTQQVNGVEVFGQRMNLLMDKNLNLTAISGYLSPHASATAQTTQSAKAAQSPFSLTMPQAISEAFNDLHSEVLPATQLTIDKQRGVYQWYRLSSPLPDAVKHKLAKSVRVKKVFYNLVDRLVPAYYLELSTQGTDSNDKDAYAYVISALDGTLLSRSNLVSSAAATPYTYRVWADATTLMPYDSPLGDNLTPVPNPPITKPAPVASNLITVTCGPISTCDPWLPATAVQTVGNNVNAYADIKRGDGYNRGDRRAHLTAPFTFDTPYNFAVFDSIENPTQLDAAIVQAFYTTNFMHDWLYDHGFNEQTGNAQDQNYGRGGEEVDRMLVEVNDYSGTNNANMYTPLDGASPIMQLYLYNHSIGHLAVTFSDSTKHSYRIFAAEFGRHTFNLAGKTMVVVDDGVSSDACELPLVNAADLVGKIAVIDRGTCKFAEKTKNAQDAGAVGVVIANNISGNISTLGGSGDAALDASITIPAIGISQAAGVVIKQAIATAESASLAVSGTLVNKTLPPYNSALDNTVVIHEWGHFLSERLTHRGLNNNQGRSMGEGWSEFLALLALVKEEDRNRSGNSQFEGAYPTSIYVAPSGGNRPYYFAIERYPYSTDMSKNPLTFKHISDGVALPAGVPINGSRDGAFNSEVHNSGEVWTSMLWEIYAELLNDNRYTFNQARDRMLDYLVESLKLTPRNPTFLEARDALLAVANTRDAGDYASFWRAFAKRGAGVNAVAPLRNSWTHSGVVEDFTTP